ncbi:4959_t:CDS:10, partial [Entrophospora sp. SA101]
MGVSKDPESNHYTLVMQYASEGNLREYLDQNFQRFDWWKKINMLKDIVLGLQSIHSVGLVHNDFHSGNILRHGYGSDKNKQPFNLAKSNADFGQLAARRRTQSITSSTTNDNSRNNNERFKHSRSSSVKAKRLSRTFTNEEIAEEMRQLNMVPPLSGQSYEDLINIKFPSIREMEPTFKISDQFIFIINPQCEMRIKEIIKLDLCLPPPEYIQYSIREFKKLPTFNKPDDITTYVRIPEFGIAEFSDLNKIMAKLDILTNRVYYSDSLKHNPPRNLLSLLNHFFILYNIKFNQINLIKEFPNQQSTLDCGIIVINYIEKELGIRSLTWSRDQSSNFRLRYLCLLTDHINNPGVINFPSGMGNLINEKFPLKLYLNYLNDIKEDDNSFDCECETDHGNEIEIDHKYGVNHENKIEIEIDHEYETNHEIDNKILDQATTLSSSNSWKSPDDAVKYIKNHARQNGFEASIISSRPTAKFLKCHYSGTKRSGRKNLDPSKHVNKLTKKTNCQWQININFSRFLGAHITKFIDKHNHEITDEDKFLCTNKLIEPKLIEEIKIYAKEKVTPAQIKNILARKYHGIQLIDKKLDNIMKYDAADLYEKLNENKNKDPLWFVEASVDIYTNKLFWINPTQKRNWSKYNDIAIIDSTYKTNTYNLILCIVIGINNEGRSVIFCQALLDHENVDSFNWFFNCMKNGFLEAPASSEKDYYNFIQDFKRLAFSISSVAFDRMWNQLIQKYFDGNNDNYLNKYIYNSKEKWGWPWRCRVMMAGVKTTSRLEGLNAVIKKQLNSKSSLIETFDTIENRIQRSEKKNINTWYPTKNINPTTIIFAAYKDIIKNTEKYLSVFCQSRIKIKIVSSQSYHFLMSSLGEILGTINDNYNDSDSDITNFISTSMKNISGENYNDENNDITASTSNIIPKDTTNDVDYDITDLRSFSLRELLISSNVEPSEVWVLKHYFGRRKQYVIVFNDDSFKSITQIIGDDPDKYEETKTLFEETYHKLKREKEEKEEREEKEIIDNDDNKIKNPIPTKTKG